MQQFSILRFIYGIWDGPFRKVWIERLVVFGVLSLAALIALVIDVEIFILIVFMFAAIGVLLVLLRWPNLGLLGVLFGGFFVAYSGPGGINLSVLAVGGLSFLWLMDMFVRERNIHFIDKRTTIPVLVFMVGALISFGIGWLPWYPLARQAPVTAQVGGLLIFLLSGMAFLLVSNTVRNLRWLQLFTWTFLAIGVLYITGRMLPPLGNTLSRFYQSSATTGAMFWLWLTIIPFSQGLINKKLPMPVRGGLLLFTAVVLFVAIVRTFDWKSGYLPPLAGIAVIVALLLKRKIIWFMPAILVLGLFLVREAIYSDIYSYITRMDAWRIVIQLTLVNPIFGIGFANYYWYTPLTSILGWRVSFNSHSQYVDIFSQTGLVGLITFFWIFWEIGKLGLRYLDRVPEGFERAYIYGALGGLVGTLVSGVLVDWVLPFVYNIGMYGFRSSILSWLFLGGIVAICYNAEQNPGKEIDLHHRGGKYE